MQAELNRHRRLQLRSRDQTGVRRCQTTENVVHFLVRKDKTTPSDHYQSTNDASDQARAQQGEIGISLRRASCQPVSPKGCCQDECQEDEQADESIVECDPCIGIDDIDDSLSLA